MSEPIWMPHPGHFILRRDCQFRLNTYVNGYIVSTIGELVEPGQDEFQQIGSDALYETMVFSAEPSGFDCCPFEIAGMELKCKRYNLPGDAMRGHMELIAEWSQKAGTK